MDLKKAFGTSKEAEKSGVWVTLDEKTSVRIARANNQGYLARLRELLRPHRSAIKANTLPDSVVESITIEAMSEHVLVDWKGIEVDGKGIPYSIEAAKKALKDFPDFRDLVSNYANDMSLFQAEAEAAETGN